MHFLSVVAPDIKRHYRKRGNSESSETSEISEVSVFSTKATTESKTRKNFPRCLWNFIF